MRASKADKFYMGMLLAIICFCFGLLRIMDEADARRAAERETLIIVEPPTIVVPASQPVQTVYFEPDPEPEEPAAEVFTFREDVPLSAELQKVLWDACQEHKVEYALALTAYNAGHDTGNREYAEKVMAAAERWRTE